MIDLVGRLCEERRRARRHPAHVLRRQLLDHWPRTDSPAEMDEVLDNLVAAGRLVRCRTINDVGYRLPDAGNAQETTES